MFMELLISIVTALIVQIRIIEQSEMYDSTYSN